MTCSNDFTPLLLNLFFGKRLTLRTRRLIMVFVVVILVGFVDSGFAGNQKTLLVEPNANAEVLTNSLGVHLGQYLRANPNNKNQLVNDLITLATERKEILASLIEENPAEVLRLALPEDLRERLPEGVKKLVERRVELEGEVTALHIDFKDGSHGNQYFFHAGNGKKFSLHFASEPGDLLTGMKVKVRGVLLEGISASSVEDTTGEVALKGDSESVEILAYGDSSASGTTSGEISSGPVPLLENTFGEQRTLVLLINFADMPTEPWTVEEARNTVFGTVNDFFSENSFGQTWLTGDVFGWFTIPYDISTCREIDIAAEAKEAAINAGIDLSAYNRYVYAYPDIGCPGSGLGTVGGDPSEAWIQGYLHESDVVAHELGHNFGLAHSHGLDCGFQVLGENCLNMEYGDVLDIMGMGGGHYNAFQKLLLGWLNFGTSPPIVDVTTSGIYHLEPYAQQTNGPKALKIRQSVDQNTGQSHWYFVEFRQAIGFDSFLSGRYAEVLNGLVIHRATEGDRNSSYLLDMTPGSQPYDFDDLALAEGETYSDPVAGVTITAESISQEGATVSVNFQQPGCIPSNPTLAISPSESQWATPGTPVPFIITVTNNDSPGCTAALFDLTAIVPDAWTDTFGQPLLTLDPGSSASTTFEVTSSPSAPDMLYSVELAVQNSNSGYEDYTSVTYVVSSDLANAPPVAIDDSAVTLQGTPVTIEVTANDYDPENDLLTVTQVTQGLEGSVLINSDSTLTYIPRLKTKNSDHFTYTVTDGHSNASATVSVKLQRSGTNDKRSGSKGGGKPSK